MQKFVVRIEWTDESITEEVVSEKAWFGLLYEALEANNDVENYQVYTITV
jgi:hypothetical protein